MVKKAVHVKSHEREYKLGKFTDVHKYTKHVEQPEVSKKDVENVKSGKSTSLSAEVPFFFHETSSTYDLKGKISVIGKFRLDQNNVLYNVNFESTKVKNDVLLKYEMSYKELSEVKKSIERFREEGKLAYYYNGSINGNKIFRVYVSEGVVSKKKTRETKSKKREPDRSRRLENLQISSKDWSHLSVEYPNLLGITDEEVENYFKVGYYPYSIDKLVQDNYPSMTHEDSVKTKEYLAKEYVKKIKCFNRNDILELSGKVHKDFLNQCKIFENDGNNPFSESKVAYVTSPRGGFEVLSEYSYANRLDKNKLPFDFELGNTYETSTKNEKTLKSVSLPYGASIEDVNDIVFIDDICLSGEQERRARIELDQLVENIGVSKNQIPRLHYVVLVGNKERFVEINGNLKMKNDQANNSWSTVSIGELHDFTFGHVSKSWNDVSAVVFPHSIPDGHHHNFARLLYSSSDKFKHTKY